MKRLSLKVKILLSIATLCINLYCFFIFANNYKAIYYPSALRIDLQILLAKNELTDHDYSQLLHQTGLGRPSVDSLMSKTDGKEKILEFQEYFYRKYKVFIEKLNPFTSQETLSFTGKPPINNSGLAPLKNGDILLTKSTQTLFWRHGHCGIVIDAEKGISLESLEPGTVSMKQNVCKWQYYPTLKILRLKNVDDKILDQVAKYSVTNLLGKRYEILASKYIKRRIPEKVNCSQIIWQAFNYFGYDLDSNKGIIVTPEDIAKSPLLEIVQVRGFDPDKVW